MATPNPAESLIQMLLLAEFPSLVEFIRVEVDPDDESALPKFFRAKRKPNGAMPCVVLTFNSAALSHSAFQQFIREAGRQATALLAEAEREARGLRREAAKHLQGLVERGCLDPSMTIGEWIHRNLALDGHPAFWTAEYEQRTLGAPCHTATVELAHVD